MKKIILTFCVMIMSVINSAYADVLLGDHKRCIVNTDDEDKYYFYFCGKGNNDLNWCRLRKVGNRIDDVSDYVTSERVVEVDNNKYYMCCDGDEWNTGRFISVDDETGVKHIETKTKYLGGDATCKYTITTNACGTETMEQCTVPDRCLNGKKLKDGQCVSDCGDGYVEYDGRCYYEKCPDDKLYLLGKKCVTQCSDGYFKMRNTCVTECDSGYTPNEGKCILDCDDGFVEYDGMCVRDCDDGYTLIGTDCVPDSELDPDDRGGYGGGCPITKYQGLGVNNECVRCNRDSEFFDKKKLKCVKRSGMVNADKDVMKRCWRCKNDKLFKQCIIIMFQTGKPVDSALVRDCYLAEKADTSAEKADTSVASMSNNEK